MCEAKVYLTDDPTGKPVMEDVILLQPEGDEYVLVNLFGEQKRVRGQLERINFLRHTVYLTTDDSPRT